MIDPELVRRFYRHMLGVFDAVRVDKQRASEMRAVAQFLGVLGVLDKTEFLERFATTIGKRIYLPFEPGVATDDWSLWSQLVVLVHECEHVVQYKKLGWLRFYWSYALSKASRARLEAEAYRSNLEMHYWQSGEILNTETLASHLRHYGIRDADVKVAAMVLRVSAAAVRSGAIINRSTKEAIRWLDEQAPELRR